MASTDYPRGFWPKCKMDGSPFSGLIRSAGASDSNDIFLYDLVTFSSGLLAQAATNSKMAGVAVGFGRNPGGMHGGANVGPFNPRDLEEKFYDTSATTNTEYVIYYVPCRDVLFEGQQDDATDLVVAADYDITVGTGSSVTGISAMEIDGDASTNDDLKIIRPVKRPGISATDTNADWEVVFLDVV